MVENLLYSKIIADVDEKISNGLLLPGQKLPSERKLSIHYQVSRTVVREAIKVLCEKGLAKVEIGKGTYITRPTKNNVTQALHRVIQSSSSTIEDIIEVREELELSAIKKAVIHATEAELKKLSSVCHSMDRKNIAVGDFVKKDAEFHLELAKLTGNQIFYLLISSFYDLIETALFDITHMVPGDIEEAQRQHWIFVESIADRDMDLAEKIVKKHINLIREEVKLLQGKNLL